MTSKLLPLKSESDVDAGAVFEQLHHSALDGDCRTNCLEKAGTDHDVVIGERHHWELIPVIANDRSNTLLPGGTKMAVLARLEVWGL